MSKARDLASAAPAPSTVSATELGYLDGVTSAVQTQMNTKQAVVSGVNDTEIGYLDGVTSAIQTQINSKIGQSTAINPTIVDAKGDIIAASAADTVARLAVGANDTVLTADSSAATGLKWATPAAGGMTLISETVASGVTGITFGSIPSTYKQLLLIWSGTQHSTSGSGFVVRFNNDSGSNYQENYVSFNNANITQGGSTTDSVGGGPGLSTFGGENNTSDVRWTGKGSLLIDNYSSATKTKTYELTYAYRNIANAQTHFYNGVGYYSSTTAITSLDIVRTYGSATLSNMTNTTIRLYGLS